MEHFLRYIDIENFKSIKNLRIDGCKRINLFIGAPNVGKSNILEALSLFSLQFSIRNNLKKLDHYLRINKPVDLFHFYNDENSIQLNTNLYSYKIVFNNEDHKININYRNNNDLFDNSSDYEIGIDNKIKRVKKGDFIDKIRAYHFSSYIKYKNTHELYLSVPFGSNLPEILYNNSDLAKQFSELFKKYHYEVIIDYKGKAIELLYRKNKLDNYAYVMPFSFVADTLQRLIFHLTAIKSTHNSILLFEEPEAHCFPPYISQIANEILQSKTNQFFITTHSPFIVNELLENTKDDNELAIYIVHWKDNQTQVKLLSNEEMNEVYQYGIDLFFNSDIFLMDEKS